MFNKTKTWYLIPQNNQTTDDISKFLYSIRHFATNIEIETTNIPNATPSGFYYFTPKYDYVITTTSDENEGMIRLCMGANYDLMLKSTKTEISCKQCQQFTDTH